MRPPSRSRAIESLFSTEGNFRAPHCQAVVNAELAKGETIANQDISGRGRIIFGLLRFLAACCRRAGFVAVVIVLEDEILAGKVYPACYRGRVFCGTLGTPLIAWFLWGKGTVCTQHSQANVRKFV